MKYLPIVNQFAGIIICIGLLVKSIFLIKTHPLEAIYCVVFASLLDRRIK